MYKITAKAILWDYIDIFIPENTFAFSLNEIYLNFVEFNVALYRSHHILGGWGGGYLYKFVGVSAM